MSCPKDKPSSAKNIYGRLFGKVIESMTMRPTGSWAHASRYSIALLMVTAALGIRELIGPAELGLQFVTFFPAVMLAVIFAGLGPAVLAAAVSALLATFFYMPPYGALPFGLDRAVVLPNLVFLLTEFVACGAILSVSSHNRRLRIANERLIAKCNPANDACAIASAYKQLEASLQQERALLANLLNGTDVMLVYLDRDFNFIWVNQSYAKTCHMTLKEMVGKNHFALYPHAENEDIFRGVRDTGVPVFFKNKPFEFPDQPERGLSYWDWSLVPDKNEAGSVAGLVLSLQETTAHVHALHAARESEGRFIALADAAPVLIWMSGPDKRCAWVNRQWLNFTGRSMEQELGYGWVEALHPDDVVRCVEIYNRSFDQRQSFTMDYRLRAATGEYRWLVDKGSPHHATNGEFLGYIGTCADITERRQAEDALRDNEQKLKLFIEEAPSGIAMLDNEMRYLAASRRFLEDYYLAHTNIIGRCHYDIFHGIPERWRDVHRRCLAGETLSSEEDPFIRGDGSVKWMRWELRPWFAASGEIGGIIIFAEDVSQRKQAEDELRAAQADAEQANNAKSRFLAAASHDLRQPLSALSLYVGMLKNKVAPVDVPLLNNMTNCVSSLSELLADLLDLSKLEAGVVRPEVSDFSVADLLSNLNSLHAPEAGLKGLDWRCHSSKLNARTDPVLFRRIVGNFITNAIRYTEKGGVLVGCRRLQGKRWIEVWDTGIGVPEDKIGEIFEEFRQLDNDERNRGSGLGLAIAAKAATLLGLAVRVHSSPGKGSMFAVELPPGQTSMAMLQPEPEGLQLRIALVDDNSIVLNAMTYALKGMGHQVVPATTGEELLGQLGSRPPHIVISDFRLAGGQTGFDVIAAVRTSFDDQLPALLITGDTDPQLMRSMADRGILVQHKPVDIEALQLCIEQVISPRPFG